MSASSHHPIRNLSGDLIRDVRDAFRTLRRRPGFALTAVLVLALGLGGTVSGYTLLHGTLFRPLPFPEPDRLVSVHLHVERPDGARQQMRWSYPEFEALRETLGSDGPFEAVAAFSRASFNVSTPRDGHEPFHVAGEAVSPAYLEVLGVEPALGRAFEPGGESAALLGHDLWRSRFGADPEIPGEIVRLNGVPVTVVGVLPAGFSGLTGQAQVWIPQARAPSILFPEQLTTHQHFNTVVARLRPGRSVEQAAAVLEGFAPVLASGWGAVHGPGEWGALPVPLARDRVDPEQRRARWILFGAALLVLLIAGANFAGLLLGRGLSRRRELAIRRALGSSRGRLVRRLVTESVLLAGAGGALGVLLALWLTGAGETLLPDRLATPANDYAQLAAFADLAVDGRVLAVAALVSVAAGVIFGLGPALLATRRTAERELSADAGGDSEHRGGSLASPFGLLVVAEVALALTLLVGAALLLQTLAHLSARPGADRPEEVLTFRLEPSLAQYSSEDGPALLGAVLERVSAVPGVRSATVGPCAPGTTGCATREVRLPGMDPDAEPYAVRRHYVGPEHFETLGIALLRGRGLAPSDRPGRPAVTVINRRAAETLWPGEDPIGRRIVLGEGEFLGGGTTAEVVGVVEDVPYGVPGEPIGLDLYTSYRQFSRQFTTVMVRSAGTPPEALLPDLRRAVAAVDPDLPLHDVATLAERTDRLLAGPRFRGGLLALFAGLALLLAAVGVYGVLSQLVARRTREMGVRIALGARRGQVVALVVRRALAMALAGVAVGALGAWSVTGVLSSQLFGVDPADPLAFAVAAGLLLAAGVLAALLPARRATRVDPMRVLRVE